MTYKNDHEDEQLSLLLTIITMPAVNPVGHSLSLAASVYEEAMYRPHCYL